MSSSLPSPLYLAAGVAVLFAAWVAWQRSHAPGPDVLSPPAPGPIPLPPARPQANPSGPKLTSLYAVAASAAPASLYNLNGVVDPYAPPADVGQIQLSAPSSVQVYYLASLGAPSSALLASASAYGWKIAPAPTSIAALMLDAARSKGYNV